MLRFSKNEKNIGIFGGTFDPVHLGHLQCAKVVADKLFLDKVLFMPANIPNFKQDKDIASANYRFLMCELAIKDFKDIRFIASNYEIMKKGVTYTSDTIRDIKKQLDNNINIYFICGSDSAYSIESWHNYAEIFNDAKLISVGRKGIKKDLSKQNKLKIKYGSRIEFVEADVIDCSSSEIRQNITNKELIDRCLTKSVYAFIKNKKLYGFKN